MSLDTGRSGAPGPGDNREGEPAGTANHATGQPAGAETHAGHPSTAAADATRHSDVSPGGWPSQPVYVEGRRTIATTPAETQGQDQAELQTGDKDRVDKVRRTLIIGGATVGTAALVELTLAPVRKLFGAIFGPPETVLPVPPQAPQNPVETAPTPEVPQQAWWETAPSADERLAGATAAGEVHTGFMEWIEWALNHPSADEQTPQGRSAIELVDSLIRHGNSSSPPYTDPELLRLGIMQLITRFGWQDHTGSLMDVVHNVDRLGIRLSSQVTGDASASLSGIDTFSVPATFEIGFEGHGSALSQDTININSDSIRHDFYSMAVSHNTRNDFGPHVHQYTFVYSRVDNGWMLVEINP